jgi:Flp pilus assembly protein TadD
VTQRNWIAEHDLGNYLMDEPGGMQEAMEHLRKSLEIYPDSAFTHSDMGIALVRSGRFQEAVAEFQEALRLAPDSETIAGNLRAAERDAAGK